MVQVVANAASAAKAARLKRGERITARRLHLAVERARRDRIEQDGKELPSGRIFSVRENLLGEQPAPLPP